MHVNRCLQKLKLSGVTFHHKTVHVQSWEALTEAGDFDRGYLQDEVKPEDRVRIAPLAA